MQSVHQLRHTCTVQSVHQLTQVYRAACPSADTHLCRAVYPPADTHLHCAVYLPFFGTNSAFVECFTWNSEKDEKTIIWRKSAPVTFTETLRPAVVLYPLISAPGSSDSQMSVSSRPARATLVRPYLGPNLKEFCRNANLLMISLC